MENLLLPKNGKKARPFMDGMNCHVTNLLGMFPVRQAVKKSLAQNAQLRFRGFVMDRDHNAATNIRQKGIKTLPVECREITPLERMPLTMSH